MGGFILSGIGPVLCPHSHTSLARLCVQPLLDLVLAVGLAERTLICGWPVITSHPAHTWRGPPRAQVPWAVLLHSPAH